MPRSTAKSRQNVNGNSNAIQTITPPPMVPKTVPTASKRRTTVKREPGSATEAVTEQVFHRKSERRRVARDIFLVIEEQPSTRRSRGSNKKQPKPKFSHLKVEESLKPKGLLRDIKNEPKCYLGGSSISSVKQKREGDTVKKKSVNSATKSHFKVWSSEACTSHSPAFANGNSLEFSKVPQEDSKSTDDDFQVARVNPIFLWAKQENTRIIEVRCEDYDKRNRIRITKTSNGWRAIPRSDPTSSKVLKLYTSPLIKVKHENHVHEISHISQNSLCNVLADNKPIVVAREIVKQDIFPDPNEIGIQIGEIDTVYKPASKKSKKKKSKKRKNVFTCKKATIKINVANDEETDQQKCNNTFTSELCGDGEVVEKDCSGKINECTLENTNVFPTSDIKSTQNITKGLIKISPPITGDYIDEVLLSSTYQTVDEDDNSFQLCPKTGLFLRNAHIAIEDDDDVEIVECTMINGTDKKIDAGSEIKSSAVDDNNESLEAKTRNLKDLLDDADLFQHCDDNANSDADLIDTLVKSSCENNLIQDNETMIKDTIDNLQNKNTNATGNDLAQLISEVSEPPKCLSFNEAGEIEALNCELFQSNAYIDTFEKQSSTTSTLDTQLSPHTIAVIQTNSQPPTTASGNNPIMSNNDNIVNNNGVTVIEDSPKDLSYKKREEVCPPSESRSQCAVTSSSDVVKSPKLDDSSVLASSSETLKNLILEQFMKLNTISSHQKEPIEMEKQMEITHLNSIYSKCRLPSSVIETVVIDDDDSATDDNQIEGDEEPLKKRLRSNALPAKTIVDGDYNVKSKMAMIDKDPDPLTQLRLLIRNSQWKVPDPILVPKDRLSAVLASPAREIPLLITTRPELRLPEAFAYPEIIQNPNILVISMAQLEAILKNDIEVDKSKLKDSGTKSMSSPIFKQHSSKNGKCAQNSHQSKKMLDLENQILTEEGTSGITPSNTLSTATEERAKCSHIDSSLSSDINAATMAVLNQMLWLPYFGQISQDFMKSLKNPQGLSQKMASLLPFSGSKVNGVQHLDEICDKSKRNRMTTNIPSDNSTSNGLYANSALSSMLKKGQTDELSLLQKIVQHQMQNVINFSQAKSGTTESSMNSFVPNNSTTEQSTQQIESIGHNLSNFVGHNNKNTIPTIRKDFDQNYNHIIDAAGKTYNLRSSTASRQSSDSNQYHKGTTLDNKPRLTCKSLSNLLDPEHNQPQNMSSPSNTTIPCVSHLEDNFQKCINGIKEQTMEKRNISRVGGCVVDVSVVKPGNSKILDTANDVSKQKQKVVENILETGLRNGESSALSTETNIPLWHPLFGSNSKSAYSSPWQWTTVTAAGE